MLMRDFIKQEVAEKSICKVNADVTVVGGIMGLPYAVIQVKGRESIYCATEDEMIEKAMLEHVKFRNRCIVDLEQYCTAKGYTRDKLISELSSGDIISMGFNINGKDVFVKMNRKTKEITERVC